MRQETIPRATLASILFCFFLSGAAGLVYQVAWSKALGLIFGHTLYALATVLAVFMGGLAAGSAVLGRWSEKRADAVALYAWLELGVATAGALSLVGLAGVRALYMASYHAVAGSAPALLTLRFVASAAVLFVPTFLMGGTLPILVRGLTRASGELARRLGRLYWVNTAGAVAGTSAAGFVLLPALGLKRTVGVAVALNILAGCIALLISRRLRSRDVAAAAESEPSTGPLPYAQATSAAETGREGMWLLLGGFALVGATGMAYEIGWTRLLATMLGSSTYAFTLMLATFLAGIVAGTIFFEWWAGSGRNVSRETFAATQTLTALAAMAFLFFFNQLPEVVPPLLGLTNKNLGWIDFTQHSFGVLVLTQFVLSGLAMLPAALIFGFNFPVVTLLIAGREAAAGRTSSAVGRAYAVNTLGAIAGAMATGFWLAPKLGSFRLVALAAAANLALAFALTLRRMPRSTPSLALNGALLVLAAGLASSTTYYNRNLAVFGTVLYWDLYEPGLKMEEVADTTDLIYAEDGLNASISVVRAEDYIALRTNGKVDASNNDKVTQLIVGHLGPLVHPAPRRVLVIGFGSGMTVSALALYPEIERIDCVEIEPAVLHAADYLTTLNRGAHRHPRVHVILDDARNFLLTTRETYDIIVSEPSNPWIAGVSALFTQEFYREARARLRPGGMFLQWVQAYSLYPEDLRMVMATFLPEFPRVSLWRGESADFVLLAETAPRPIRLERLRRFWEDDLMRSDFARMGLGQPEGLAGMYLLDDVDLRKMPAGALRNTDDQTRLEYRAPRALLAKGLEDKNRQAVRALRSATLPRDFEVDDHATLLRAAAETLLNLEGFADAGTYVNALAKLPPSAQGQIVRGRWMVARGLMDGAKAAYDEALRLDPKSLEAAHGLADVARRRGDYMTAELLLRQIVAREPQWVPALQSLANLEQLRERWREAADWQSQRIGADAAPDAAAYAQLGEYLLRTEEIGDAEGAFLMALARDPYNYAARRNLGEIYRRQSNWQAAIPHLESVVRYQPTMDVGTYISLADTYRGLGRQTDATAILRKGRRLFPKDTTIQKALTPN